MTQVNISADVSAKITRLEVKEGEWVEEGTLLLELDRERYLAAVESAEANLSAAQANANLARENMVKAEKDHERTKELFDRNLESQAVLDTVYAAAEVEKARYQSALDQVEQAKAALRQSRDDLAKTTIYAPMSGTISKLNKEVGEIALGLPVPGGRDPRSSPTSRAWRRWSMSTRTTSSRWPSATRPRSRSTPCPDVKLKGGSPRSPTAPRRPARGPPTRRPSSRSRSPSSSPCPELRPGMTASAEIVTEVRDDCLSVPIQCVAVRTLEQLGAEPAAEGEEPRFVPDSDGFVEIVWVVADGRAHARQVKTGIQSETHIEIVRRPRG